MPTEEQPKVNQIRAADILVCGIAGFQTCDASELACPADWKVGDTADKNVCATIQWDSSSSLRLRVLASLR